MVQKRTFKSVVFAGGGSRCVWQVGFWEAIEPVFNLNPDVVTGVSAGATMACIILSGRAGFALEYMKRATANNEKNFYPENVIKKEELFPHPAIYRKAILATMDKAAMDKLASGPELRVVLARPPRYTGPRSAVLLGFLCYVVEKYTKEPLHPQLASKAGFRADIVSTRECQTPDEVADLLLASSCTPPILPVMYRNSLPVLDGGLVDNIPVCALKEDDGPALVLLTRRYPLEKLPEAGDRLYVQPSETIPIYKWDYTNPAGLQKAYDLGRKDGERFANIYKSL